MTRAWLPALLVACGHPPPVENARILVQGVGSTVQDCTTGICQHNENTDLVRFHGRIFLVHRTAMSQILGPNSSLRISRSDDGGASFALQAILPAIEGRDLRDPHFYIVGDILHIKALARLAVTTGRDSDTDSVALETHSSDGKSWSPLVEMGPHGYSFWRIKQFKGVYYSAAYQDGDAAVDLYRSTDGISWTHVSQVYGVAADTPLETELVFMPSGLLLALVRMDGTNDELFGSTGRLRTKVCWSSPPYDSFDCPQEFSGERLDGPLAMFMGRRLIVIARKHLGADQRKRTAIYELTGNFEGGPLDIRELRELPSAGDTSYAGAAVRDDGRFVITWYSSDLKRDPAWITGMLTASDIWTAIIDPPEL